MLFLLTMFCEEELADNDGSTKGRSVEHEADAPSANIFTQITIIIEGFGNFKFKKNP